MSKHWAVVLTVSAMTVGGLAIGTTAASADAPPTPAPPHANSAICTTRIPAVLARIDRITARINGDATTRGSTQWLKAKAEKARAAGYTALADLLEARAASRTERLAELAELKGQVEHVQATDCAT